MLKESKITYIHRSCKLKNTIDISYNSQNITQTKKFCHEKIKTVTNAFEMGNFDQIGITGNYSSAQRGKLRKEIYFIIITEKLTKISNGYANYSIYQY